MAGPRHPGPPAYGHDTVEYLMLQGQVVSMIDQGVSQADIAVATGLTQSGVSKMWSRVRRETLTEAGAADIKAREVRHLMKLRNALMPKIVRESDPDFAPDSKDIMAALALSKSIRELVGADAPKRMHVGVDEGWDDEDGPRPGQQEANDLERFMELLDNVAGRGYGSGRSDVDIERARELGSGDEILDAEVVESPATSEPAIKSKPTAPPVDPLIPSAPIIVDVTRPKSQPRGARQPDDKPVTIEDIGAMNLVDARAHVDDRPGRWVDGKFLPFDDDHIPDGEVGEVGPQ